MRYSPALREFVRHWEAPGGRPLLVPHWDALGKVTDIGYGHVFAKGEEQREITAEEAEQLLDFDLYCVELAFDRLVTAEVEQHQWDGLVAFAFNVGTGPKGFGNSTMLRLVNAGDVDSAAAQFGRWVFAGGNYEVPIAGLVKRRAAERAMFERGDYDGRP